MIEFCLTSIYLIGFVFFARTTIEGCDELHNDQDEGQVRMSLREVVGERGADIWIDIIATMALMFWPFIIALGLYYRLKKS